MEIDMELSAQAITAMEAMHGPTAFGEWEWVEGSEVAQLLIWELDAATGEFTGNSHYDARFGYVEFDEMSDAGILVSTGVDKDGMETAVLWIDGEREEGAA